MCRSQKLNMLSSSKFQLSLFLMSTKSYQKFRTIGGTPQKWVGFGKPLLKVTLDKSREGKGGRLPLLPESCPPWNLQIKSTLVLTSLKTLLEKVTSEGINFHIFLGAGPQTPCIISNQSTTTTTTPYPPLVSSPDPTLVNQVKFLGLVHAFAIM